jgi:3-oxoacyl-[acyl-carrier-protein] synthase III
MYEKVFSLLDFDKEKTSYTMAREYGHLGAADIFFNLTKVLESEKIKKGDTVGVLCAGAGYTWGSAILKI